MTRKDFVAIAKTISAIPSAAARLVAVDNILPTLRASNPRFNETRFRAACYALINSRGEWVAK